MQDWIVDSLPLFINLPAAIFVNMENGDHPQTGNGGLCDSLNDKKRHKQGPLSNPRDQTSSHEVQYVPKSLQILHDRKSNPKFQAKEEANP